MLSFCVKKQLCTKLPLLLSATGWCLLEFAGDANTWLWKFFRQLSMVLPIWPMEWEILLMMDFGLEGKTSSHNLPSTMRFLTSKKLVRDRLSRICLNLCHSHFSWLSQEPSYFCHHGLWFFPILYPVSLWAQMNARRNLSKWKKSNKNPLANFSSSGLTMLPSWWKTIWYQKMINKLCLNSELWWEAKVCYPQMYFSTEKFSPNTATSNTWSQTL